MAEDWMTSGWVSNSANPPRHNSRPTCHTPTLSAQPVGVCGRPYALSLTRTGALYSQHGLAGLLGPYRNSRRHRKRPCRGPLVAFHSTCSVLSCLPHRSGSVESPGLLRCRTLVPIGLDLHTRSGPPSAGGANARLAMDSLKMAEI